MNEPIHVEHYKGLAIEIHQDEDASNPRAEWDNVGTMICFHRRHNLGDKHDYRQEDYGSWDELEEQLAKDFSMNLGIGPITLPIYLYDHSGLTISTAPFSCPWDSGQIGFLVCSLGTAKKEWGMEDQMHLDWDGLAHYTRFENGTRRTLREAAMTYLLGEIETYDNYLTGAVYGYIIKDEDGECIEDGSCWGFFGDYSEHCLQDAQVTVDHYIERLRKQRQDRKKVEVRCRVPLEKRS